MKGFQIFRQDVGRHAAKILPAWDHMATAAQLFEQQEHTHVMLKTYETFLSDLIGEFNDKNTKKKAQKVETAATDVRTAYSQYIAIASSFLTKTKDTELRKQVKDAMTMAAAEHATFQKKANEVAETMEGQDQADRGPGSETGEGVGAHNHGSLQAQRSRVGEVV